MTALARTQEGLPFAGNGRHQPVLGIVATTRMGYRSTAESALSSTGSRPAETSCSGKRGVSLGFPASGEIYHQQYLAKNPSGYCGLGGCGVPFESAELQVGEKA